MLDVGENRWSISHDSSVTWVNETRPRLDSGRAEQKIGLLIGSDNV